MPDCSGEIAGRTPTTLGIRRQCGHMVPQTWIYSVVSKIYSYRYPTARENTTVCRDVVNENEEHVRNVGENNGINKKQVGHETDSDSSVLRLEPSDSSVLRLAPSDSSVLRLACSMSLLILPSEEEVSSHSSCSLRTPSIVTGLKANDPLGTNVAMSMITEQILNWRLQKSISILDGLGTEKTRMAHPPTLSKL